MDVAEKLGLGRTGKSYAAAGADFDRDGWPDLAVSTHGAVRLYRNLEGGSFKDVSNLGRFREGGDTHGIAWLDWNADGWPDLHVARGACRGRCSRPDRIFINRVGKAFTLANLPAFVANARGSGRSVMPWDYNEDGRLDLLVLNHYRVGQPHHLALSTSNGYRDAAREAGIIDLHVVGMTAFRMENETLFVTYGRGRDGGRIFRRNARGHFVDISADLGVSVDDGADTRAAATGDVDNDGDADLYFVRASKRGQGAVENEQGLVFFYRGHMTDENAGFRMRARGEFTFHVWPRGGLERLQLRLGAKATPVDATTIRVTPADPRFAGQPDLDAAGTGIFFWRTSPEVYELRYVPGTVKKRAVNGRMVAMDDSLSLIEQHGDRAINAPVSNQLYLNDDGHLRLVDVAEDAGVGVDAEFIDFDNDGDLDLYVVNGGQLQNQLNRLYENRGGLKFVDVTEAAGVAGTRIGHAAGVLSFDYDRDGRMDLFLTNGQGPPPRNREGPYELFRNVSDAGNWLRVKLDSTVSNPMALGARVMVETEQGRQFRFVSAATGAFSTSWLPLHFGLGESDVATVTVHWPSGRVQQQRTKANRSITLREPLRAAERH